MEVHPGVFVTSAATDDYRPDPEVGGGAEEHVLFADGNLRAGLTRFTAEADADPPPWKLEETEVLYVLEGAARIAIEGGPTLELEAGDMAALPKGAVTRWHLTLPFKELWVLSSA
jgi:quercetin dioxygenase-like cupin family protein